MSLYTTLIDALNSQPRVADNSYLRSLVPWIKEIEDSSGTDQTLADYCSKMLTIARQPGFALKGDSTSDFAQLFGEAHFALLCHRRGVSVAKVPEEKNKKTPDFSCEMPSQKLFFEVKTLSVVGGGRGINTDLESSLDAHVDIEDQLAKGKSIAIGVSETKPYADKPHKSGPITAVVETLIEKARQNIKSDQYANPNTFLVLNLCLIPPNITDSQTLRPAYPDDYMFPKAMTGALWMLAFGKTGMLIHGCPEFEGRPCVEGEMEKVGILADQEYGNIAGLFVVIYPLSGNPHIYGLFRNADVSAWDDTNSELAILAKSSLTGDCWNDELDSNGYALT